MNVSGLAAFSDRYHFIWEEIFTTMDIAVSDLEALHTKLTEVRKLY